MITAGRVVVDGSVVARPSDRVSPAADIRAPADPYVSRGAYKLTGALDDLQLSVAGRALDAGASTGGFTQVLLERGCQEVVAVDVGSGQLASALRADPRVRLHERTNLRDLRLDLVGGVPVDLVVADVSFISLKLLIGPLVSVTRNEGWLLLLVKPQFEVGRERLARTGVVTSPHEHERVLVDVLEAARTAGLHPWGLEPSPIRGTTGNREYLLWVRTRPGEALDERSVAAVVRRSAE